MSDTAQSLIAYCRDNERICPQPQSWDALWKLLPKRRQVGAGWEPPLPLILGAWHYASNLEKMMRLDEHITWAENHESLTEVSSYLRALPEKDWHHLGDDI
jgi:hypothetical protein